MAPIASSFCFESLRVSNTCLLYTSAAREKDVPVCIAAGFDPPFVRKLISLGVTIFCSTGDAGFIQTGARAHISAAQELFAEAGGAK